MKMKQPPMIGGVAVVIAASVSLSLTSVADGRAAENFQKLTGTQIRAKFTGMEMTDNVHFADVF
jgi:hypothetical protein